MLCSKRLCRSHLKLIKVYHDLQFFFFEYLLKEDLHLFFFLESGCRPRCVDAELDPGGRGKELVGKGLTTQENQILIAHFNFT